MTNDDDDGDDDTGFLRPSTGEINVLSLHINKTSPLCHFSYLSLYLPVCLSTCVHVNLPKYLSPAYLSIHLSVYLSSYLFIFLSLYPSTYQCLSLEGDRRRANKATLICLRPIVNQRTRKSFKTIKTQLIINVFMIFTIYELNR